MPKTITSPVERFPGTLVIADPMTFQQAIAVEKSWRAATTLGDGASVAEYQAAWLPGLCACVVECQLDGMTELTPDTFPATPRTESAKLISWLIGEVVKVYGGGSDDPNA